MRILGFTKKWQKLSQSEFTTFRFARRDKDWQVGEQVQVVFMAGRKQRELLGIARIIGKEMRYFFSPIDVPNKLLMGHSEAKRDGFEDYYGMRDWLKKIYGNRIYNEPMNKLTLKWIKRSI